MKLATVRDGTRDGRLVVVARDLESWVDARAVAPTLQRALDDWERAEPALSALAGPALPFDAGRLAAPLPRAYEWVDGSAYLNHVVLVRRARNAEPPPTLLTDPLVYQGGSSVLLGARDPVVVPDAAW